MMLEAERKRLSEEVNSKIPWKKWGPYLSERSWGTVREDYSPNGAAWEFLPHDWARSKAYRWGEDGLAGWSDNMQYLCFALALWNEHDPILKERAFGLTGNQGNHGEDVKEYYFYLDSTPTHSYAKYLYKYPQAEYPYAKLIEENAWPRRDRSSPEYELIDTGIFNESRYFDVVAEYAKAGPDDILIRLSVTNRGPEAAPLHLLPTLWFRNTWVWGYDAYKPELKRGPGNTIEVNHKALGQRWFYCEAARTTPPELLFCENETNNQRLYGGENVTPYVKDGINDYVVQGRHGAVNPAGLGTKAAAHYRLIIQAGQTVTVQLRLSNAEQEAPFGNFGAIFKERLREANEFYAELQPGRLSHDEKLVQRQALAGMLWSKQFYYYDVEQWLYGDPAQPVPPAERTKGRNRGWIHLNNADIISMPDKWEYPWYAAWDLAFHTIALAQVDPDFAKDQLVLMCREWYMHPNGQLPAYEWAFGDVNPPVHAWAAWRVYKIDHRLKGKPDTAFLEKVFHKLLLNFTWWVNRKDAKDQNIFEGGFLGLDNIGVFDRSAELPTGGHLEQSDATSWMGMYCLNLLTIALELARTNPVYEDVATKFFEHFVYISHAMNNLAGGEVQLWNEEDGFFYDALHTDDGRVTQLKVRSMVGLIPLYAVDTLEPDLLEMLPDFKMRLEWFYENRPDLTNELASIVKEGIGHRRLLSIMNHKRLVQVLARMLDETEFLSDYGIRAVSRYHKDQPYILEAGGTIHRVDYEPAESSTALFGGNSNWRGPIWMPVNYLLIEALQKFNHYYGDELKVECPTGSGKMLNLGEVAAELSRRLTRIFLRDEKQAGHRPVYGGIEIFQNDPHWRDLILFYEYFHGDNGAGIGASHQTGWTGLIAKLLQQSGGTQLYNEGDEGDEEGR